MIQPSPPTTAGYQLARDEFTDNGPFPFQLCVREARRLVGATTLTEADITTRRNQPGARRHDDAVAVGEFPVDSFPVQKRQPGDGRVLEDYLCMLRSITRPYQFRYRIMVPRKLDGLLVPVDGGSHDDVLSECVSRRLNDRDSAPNWCRLTIPAHGRQRP